MPENAAYLLGVDGLVTGYGKKQVLNGISLNVAPREIVALIGHNGAGKSTLLRAIFGLLPVWQGRIVFQETNLNSHTPRKMLKLGAAYVPQGNRVFTDLTVRENLEMAGITLSDEVQLENRIERVFSLFPVLKPRLRQRAGTLSGGEQQMLALASALILSPRLLLLDEPSLGLAPPLVSQALACVRQISEESGASVLIVEQKVREVLKIAHRVCMLRNGQVSFFGLKDSLNDEKLRQLYL